MDTVLGTPINQPNQKMALLIGRTFSLCNCSLKFTLNIRFPVLFEIYLRVDLCNRINSIQIQTTDITASQFQFLKCIFFTGEYFE